MRILYLSETTEIYGAEESLLALLRNIDKTKISPFIIMPDNNGPLFEECLKIGQVNVYANRMLSKKWLTPSSKSPHGIFMAFIRLIILHKFISKFIRRNNISVVHANTNNTILYVLPLISKKIKLIAHLRNPVFARSKHFRIFNAVLRAKQVKYVSVSKKLAELLMAKYKDMDILPIYNGIEKGRTCITTSSNKKYDVINIGRIHPSKNQLHLIKGLQKIHKTHPEVKCAILGGVTDTHYYQDIKRLIKENGLDKNVKILGYRRDFRQFIINAKVIVHVPKSFDSLPRIILESMKEKKTVIGSDIGGIPELIIDNQTGFLVDPNDVKMLADKIVRVLENDDLRKTIGANAGQFVRKRFSIQDHVDLMMKLYYGNRSNSVQSLNVRCV